MQIDNGPNIVSRGTGTSIITKQQQCWDVLCLETGLKEEIARRTLLCHTERFLLSCRVGGDRIIVIKCDSKTTISDVLKTLDLYHEQIHKTTKKAITMLLSVRSIST